MLYEHNIPIDLNRFPVVFKGRKENFRKRSHCENKLSHKK